MRTPLPTRIAALLVAVAVPSCAQIIGLDDYHDGICVPGSKTREGCPYGGPAGTKDVGICSAGEKVCNEDGTAWGNCSDPILPKDEDCSTPLDENCDGEVNEKTAGCCTSGETFSCYSGAAGTEGVGACKAGTQTCGADGTTVGACAGEVKPTQELCSDTIDNDCDHRECVEWAVNYGDVTTQLAGASAVDKDGNIYIGGYFDGTITLGQTTLTSTGSDAFLIKLDPAGKPLWGKSYGGFLSQEVTAIATDAQGNVVFGGRTADTIDLGGGTLPVGLFVAKLSPDGDHVWSQSLAVKATCTGSDSIIWSVATMSMGDVVVGGYYCGKFTAGDAPVTSNGRDAFIARLSADKGLATKAAGGWVLSFGDSAMQEVARVAVGPSNTIVAAANFQGQIDFGSGSLVASAGYDAVVFELDAAGKSSTYDLFRGTGDQELADLALDAIGGVVVSGNSDSTYSNNSTSHPAGGFVVRYGAGLSVGWRKDLGTAYAAVAIDSANNVALSGLYKDSVDLGDGAPLTTTTAGAFGWFLGKISSNGSVLWKRGFAVDPSLYFFSGGRPHFTSTGELLTVGGFGSSVDLGGLTVTSNGDVDILVAKFGL